MFLFGLVILGIVEERGRGREKHPCERHTPRGCLPPEFSPGPRRGRGLPPRSGPLTGIKPGGDPAIRRPLLYPLTQTGQGLARFRFGSPRRTRLCPSHLSLLAGHCSLHRLLAHVGIGAQDETPKNKESSCSPAAHRCVNRPGRARASGSSPGRGEVSGSGNRVPGAFPASLPPPHQGQHPLTVPSGCRRPPVSFSSLQSHQLRLRADGCPVAGLGEGGGRAHRAETSRAGVNAGPERRRHMPSSGARALGKGHGVRLTTAAAGRAPHTPLGSGPRAKPVAPGGRLSLQ